MTTDIRTGYTFDTHCIWTYATSVVRHVLTGHLVIKSLLFDFSCHISNKFSHFWYFQPSFQTLILGSSPQCLSKGIRVSNLFISLGRLFHFSTTLTEQLFCLMSVLDPFLAMFQGFSACLVRCRLLILIINVSSLTLSIPFKILNVLSHVLGFSTFLSCLQVYFPASF